MVHPYVWGEDGRVPSGPDALASFDVEHVHGCAVVVAAGEIDVSTSPGLREALSRAAACGDRILVDLTAVSFLDSTGIGVLLGLLRMNHNRSGTPCLIGPAGSVRKVLDITQVTGMLPIYPTVEEAVWELAFSSRSWADLTDDGDA